MNLIPNTGPLTYNYYCTFTSQGVWGCEKRLKDVVLIRNRINSEFLFGKNGLLHAHPASIRQDLLVLLDDGWDVPLNTTHTEKNSGLFGSMIVNEDKFPEFKNLNPYDRLKKLSDKIKAMGYAGLGLWVPANHFGEAFNEKQEIYMADGEKFWIERGKMCAYADVKYLKVDWGFHGRDVGYRQLITDQIKESSPKTMIEHAIGVFGQAFDPPPQDQERYEFKQFMQLGKETFKVGDFYRTYDVLDDLSEVSTLMRIAKLCKFEVEPSEKYKGIVNVEDNPIIAAALGMSMGIMRHKPNPRYFDVVKALKWQRIAPPVRFDYKKFHISNELLCDSYEYHLDKNFWPYIGNETIQQFAPSSISMNIPPVHIEKKEALLPFILASKNPVTGAYTVASIEINKNNKKYIPLTNIRVYEALCEKPIGLFGRFNEINIEFDKNIEGKRVYMQNLLEAEAVDITADVVLSDNILKIYGNKTETNGVVIKLI